MSSRSIRFIVVAALAFLAGVVVGWCFFGSARQAEAERIPYRVSASPSAAAEALERPVGNRGIADEWHNKDSVAPAADDVRLPVPVAKLVRAYGSPLGPDLIPTDNLMSLDFNDAEVKLIQGAFRDFKETLEEHEKRHARLKTGPEGDCYEIMPFELPASEIQRLRDRILAIAGHGDWRADFLMESLKASSAAGGLGRYRQEVGLEEHILGGVTTYAVMSRVFDQDGKEIDGAGYQVHDMNQLNRYRNLFEQR